MNISKNAIEGKTKTNIKQAVKLGHLEHLILFCSNYNSWEPEKHMEQHLFIKQVKPGISAWLLAWLGDRCQVSKAHAIQAITWGSTRRFDIICYNASRSHCVADF